MGGCEVCVAAHVPAAVLAEAVQQQQQQQQQQGGLACGSSGLLLVRLHLPSKGEPGVEVGGHCCSLRACTLADHVACKMVERFGVSLPTPLPCPMTPGLAGIRALPLTI